MNIKLTLRICSAGFSVWLKPSGKKSPEACTKIFQDNDVFGFIARCYDFLHLSSYECALDDVEEMLKNRGVSVC